MKDEDAESVVEWFLNTSEENRKEELKQYILQFNDCSESHHLAHLTSDEKLKITAND